MAKLFGGGSAPAPQPPAVMPSPSMDDEAVRKARRNAMAAAQQRGGRAATILTEGEKLG